MAASFIGLLRLGIHHVPSSGSSHPVRFRTGSVLVFFVVRAVTPIITITPCHPRLGSQHPVVNVQSINDRRGAAGTRTPDLRRARAALSQLSYGPLPEWNTAPPRGGRAWTRTRDLGLIRAAL